MLQLLSGLLGGKDGALKTISKVVDDLHTSEEEKLDKKILMQRIQQKLAEKQLDVNAIAKGWGVDMLFNLIKSLGYQNFMVEIGGEIRLAGKNNINFMGVGIKYVPAWKFKRPSI